MSGLLGFLVAKYLAGHTVGKPGRMKSFKIPLGRYKLHLHHWLISSGVIAFSLTKGIPFIPAEVFWGFLSGLALQGIYCYNDWYKILIPRYLMKDHSGSETLSKGHPRNTLKEGNRGDTAKEGLNCRTFTVPLKNVSTPLQDSLVVVPSPPCIPAPPFSEKPSSWLQQ